MTSLVTHTSCMLSPEPHKPNDLLSVLTRRRWCGWMCSIAHLQVKFQKLAPPPANIYPLRNGFFRAISRQFT